MSSCGCNSIGPSHNQGACCTSRKVCTTPLVITPDTVKAECIFVEKVYDAVLLKEEKTIFEEVTFPIASVPIGSTFHNVTVNCLPKPIPNVSDGLNVTGSVVTINGITPPVFFTPIGPGGIEQTDLSFIDTAACDAKGIGTKIIVHNQIEISGEVVLVFSGTLIKPDGTRSQFSVQQTLDFVDFTIDKFVQLCIPSTYAAQKPSLAELVAANCSFILPLGDNSLSVTTIGEVKVNGLLLFCIICEKKVKVPVQLCVLATDFCQPEEIGGLCVDFPSLFPPQVDLQLK
jgi:hypothetical protein